MDEDDADTETAPAAATEWAPMLRPFGNLARRMARLLRDEPALAPRLALAPPRALHAVAAWMWHAERAGLPEAAQRARILAVAPRTLLREALPQAPARLFQLLDRCFLPIWELEEYAGLARLLDEDAEDLLPAGERSFLPGHLREALAVLDLDETLRNAVRATGSAEGRAHLESLAVWLRATGRLDRLACLPRDAGPEGLARAIRADLGALEAPPRDFPVPAGWRRIMRAEELWQTGREMRLCTAPGRPGSGDLMVSMLMGRSIILAHEAPPTLAQLREMPGGLWFLEQVRSSGNKLATPLEEGLTEALRAAGVQLVPTSLQGALDHLLDVEEMRRARRPGRFPASLFR